MRRFLLILPLFLAGGCETTPRPYAPVDNVRYSALGENPFWLLAIGDDRIVLRQSPEEGDNSEAVWPRTLPRTVDGKRFWESGDGTQVITIETSPGPCADSRGRNYEDHVRVRLSGRELNGCGGRLYRG
jgi:uncharacterized membrane protein